MEEIKENLKRVKENKDLIKSLIILMTISIISIISIVITSLKKS